MAMLGPKKKSTSPHPLDVNSLNMMYQEEKLRYYEETHFAIKYSNPLQQFSPYLMNLLSKGLKPENLYADLPCYSGEMAQIFERDDFWEAFSGVNNIVHCRIKTFLN